jgi:monoamine oxidase
MTPLPQNPDVVVIGAGAAGLSAAKTLQDAGVEVLLLEAADHIGGRCVTDTTTFATPFDRGGSWLHAAPINPLARIAEDQGDVLHKSKWDWTRLHVEGAMASPEDVAAYKAYQDGMWDVINTRGGQHPDISIKDAMPKGRWRDTAIWWVPAMVGGDADVTSTQDSFNYAEAEGDWLIEGGLGAFVARLHEGVPVVLNCPVSQIDTSGKAIKLSTPKGDIKAAHVILTVSTGVLAAQTIAFVPPLPAAKQSAIQGLPNGLLNKVGIEFDPAWQQVTQGDMADYHAGGEAFCSLAFGFYDTPLAVGFIAGRFAADLEREGAGAATDFCLEALRATYGAAALKHVKRTDETAWRTNPLTYGSYSYATPSQSAARAVLAEPLEARLFFAGEATMKDTYSTVHGAYLSGQRAAAEVLAARESEGARDG